MPAMLSCVQGFGGERVVEALLGASVCTHPARAASAQQPLPPARGQSDPCPFCFSPSSKGHKDFLNQSFSYTKFGVDSLPVAGGSRHRRAMGGAQPW